MAPKGPLAHETIRSPLINQPGSPENKIQSRRKSAREKKTRRAAPSTQCAGQSRSRARPGFVAGGYQNENQVCRGQSLCKRHKISRPRNRAMLPQVRGKVPFLCRLAFWSNGPPFLHLTYPHSYDNVKNKARLDS